MSLSDAPELQKKIIQIALDEVKRLTTELQEGREFELSPDFQQVLNIAEHYSSTLSTTEQEALGDSIVNALQHRLKEDL